MKHRHPLRSVSILILMLCLSALCLPTAAPAQQSWYYPLAKGNSWTYGEELLPGHWAETFHTRILGDTVMPNGHRYAVWDSHLFHRQVGLQVLQYRPEDSSEFVLFDFALKSGDTLRVLYIPATEFRQADTITTVVITSQQRLFGVLRPVFSFFTSQTAGPGAYWVTIADSLGDVSHGGEGAYFEYLLRANIDSRVYTSVDGGEHFLQQLPLAPYLAQNYPNPFNPLTTIRYALPHRSHVRLVVFNTLGQEVVRLVDADIEAGVRDVVFDAAHLASGVYFYRLQAGNFTKTRNFCLIK